MFEKLAGNVFSKILSKYFTDESLANNQTTKSVQLGIWSGYISLHNLEIETDIVNVKLRQKGQPLELVHCSIKKVEVTIPWAKLSNPITIGKSRNGSSQDAVVVLVIDGVHALFRTSFSFHDSELRTEEIRRRRQALSRSERFTKSSPHVGDDAHFSLDDGKKTYIEIIKQRITDEMFQGILDKLHVHIRDLHLRIEDVSNAEDPCAFGITMESMHVQGSKRHGQEITTINEKVVKNAQINHFAAYWNTLDYGDDLPIENSILHEIFFGEAQKLSIALDSCIVKRGSLISSPRTPYIPSHTFVLMPVGGQLQVSLSHNPRDLSIGPAVAIDIHLDSISTNLRDFQCVQILNLFRERKNFQFVKRYRKFRPNVSVLENPKDWWFYAARVIKFELKENFLRWSRSRFEKKYAIRARYMELYKRRVRQFTKLTAESSDEMVNESFKPLSQVEKTEIQDLEDGIYGDLSVSDIILYRALVLARVGGSTKFSECGGSKSSSRLSWWKKSIQDATVDDLEAKEEFDRLLEYLDKLPNNNDTSMPEMRSDSLVAITATIQVEAIRFALFSPLSITARESKLKRIHEKFLEFYSQGTKIGGNLRGDYKNFSVEFSVTNFTACEIRKDKSQHIVATQLDKEEISSDENDDNRLYEQPKSLLYFIFTKEPTENPGVGKELRVHLNPIELSLSLECQWLGHLKVFMSEITEIPNVAKFWGEISFAYFNSLALGKLGLMAKAESAASDHKNFDVDIMMHCPVFRIDMGDGGDLVIDLGFLSLKTYRLAGISRNKLMKLPLFLSEQSIQIDATPFELRQNNTDESSSSNSKSSRIPSSIFRGCSMVPLQKPIRNLLISSGRSIDTLQASERGNQSFTGSFNLDDTFPHSNPDSHEKKNLQESVVEELFYDKYHLYLKTGKITFSGESELFDISMGFELRTMLQKSVIPSDSTLCKLKIHTSVGRIKLVLNEALVLHFMTSFKMWKALVQNGAESQTFRILEKKPHRPEDIVDQFIPNRIGPTYDNYRNGSESGSEIDEREFFDACENSDSIGENNSGIWFEDHWITDAESVIDGGSRGSSTDRRSHRRARSISDVSSMSDHSKHYRYQFENGYLNAENLARLEEGVGEDESIAESGQENDNDSFHSVMSSSNQIRLLRDLEDSIETLESKIKNFSAILVKNTYSFSGINDAALQQMKHTRKKTKQELQRSKLELKALKVVRHDLEILLSDDHCDLGLELNDDVLTATTMQQTRTAKALILATQHRDSSEEYESDHKLVQNLNRELFQGSVIFSELQLILRESDDADECLNGLDISEFDFTANQVALVHFHFANDTKIYFSIDQATTNLTKKCEEQGTSSVTLFSGGSNDTTLPIHLPHLVAHSMEDRFIRAVIDARVQRSTKDSRQQLKLIRLRVVVGDIEILLSPKSLAPVLRCFHRVKTIRSSFEPVQHKDVMLKDKKKEKTKNALYYSDLAIRLTSTRFRFTHYDQIVGALVVSESSFRVLRRVSEVQQRVQVDIRCTNAQVLDIISIDTGRGSEILGRRDPYGSLCQLRLRSQDVSFEERGGWVTGTDKIEIDDKNASCEVKNFHIGIKVSPLSLLASPEAISKFCNSGHQLYHCFRISGGKFRSQRKKPPPDSIDKQTPLRWRFDLVFRRINIKFPEESKNDWNVSDDIGNKMVMAFTSVISIQESPSMKSCASIRMGVTDISLIRSSDDWPIIEPYSSIFQILLSSNLTSHLHQEQRHKILPLLFKVESPLNEIDVVMARHGWDSIPSRKYIDNMSTLIFKISPLKINTSLSIVSLLSSISQSYRNLQSKKLGEGKKTESNPTQNLLPSANSMLDRRQFCVQILIEDAEIKLLQENDSKPIAYASQLISFTMTDVNIDYSQGEQVTASILIRDSALFDLTSGKGIRVIGEDREARLDFPYFVRVKFLMHLKGIQTIRLHINWGKIQCLILPSFLRSILGLREGLNNWNGADGVPNLYQKRKGNFLTRFLSHPNDVNLNLSADAETFECILASKDIIDYVKSGDKDQCGVVTFRWKASLSLAMALDCLQESSIPWLTLNLDGTFTDEDDVDLFREFVNNYLGKKSDLLVQNKAIGSELANAFTSKINYKLSSFQVLRTNITVMDLNNSSQNSFTLMPRICFKISQPDVGEQRITNPIDLIFSYRSTGISMTTSTLSQSSECDVKLAQLLNLQANFVDVLVYISSKSTGGFSDSFRVSIKPILELMQRKERSRANKDTAASKPRRVESKIRKKPTLIDLMKNSPLICRVQVEGFLVTCVPGGATRLNESPIIKFELSNISSGIAAVPVDQSLIMVGRSGANRDENSSRKFLSGAEVMHVTIGGWILCQVTGHYHNRRLVAWEPFIEPWIANISFGIDLVKAFNWKVIRKQDTNISRTPTESSLLRLPIDESSERGKDRLREIGRLIRSPFQSLQSSTSTNEGASYICHSDLCYLMLSSSARTTILSTFHKSSGSRSEIETKLFNTMPSRAPLEWLCDFGKPKKSSGSSDSCNPLSVSIVLSDTMPLNVNLTGALIENVMGYLNNIKRVSSNTVVPHLIRNSSGMTLRFREVLDSERKKHGEHASKIVLTNGSEVPLTLKRSPSQTCDPHRAYIYLELGSFEDTSGRANHVYFDIPKGKRSANFLFKATAKIPVDAVGVHRYPLDRNIKTRSDIKENGSNSRALGWIIVRVALRGSVKVVSIESPFVLKNAADADLLCEVRDERGLSLLWRCIVPKDEGGDCSGRKDGVVSVPADIVPLIHDGHYRFSATALSRAASQIYEAEIISTKDKSVEISTPPSFSSKSFNRGLIGEEEIVLKTLIPPEESHEKKDERIYLTVCAIRIGSANLSRIDSAIEVPEQRMIFFRSPLVVRNFLALPIAVQVRVKRFPIPLNGNPNGKSENDTNKLSQWEELGVLDCGESIPWTGSQLSEQVQIRVKFVGTDGDNSRRYPGWSSSVNVPARDVGARNMKYSETRTYAKMKVTDAHDVVLNLSVTFDIGNSTNGLDHSEDESIRNFCKTFSSATRTASIFVPYWIIDGTNQDLEFLVGTSVAGQLDKRVKNSNHESHGQKFGGTLGLAELMDNQNFLSTSSGSGFDVLMIGDENPPRLTVRKRLARGHRGTKQSPASPWSDSIPLQISGKARHDLTVLTPDDNSGNSKTMNDDGQCFGRLVLRSIITKANDRFGGSLGTKLIHIVNRYSISNETGRDIEIAANVKGSSNLNVDATSKPQPFHFDDSREIRFRFKEFGWSWSGFFKIRLNRREVTMRVRHRMKGQTIIITVEVRTTKKSATYLVVFHESSHPPFRLENHTMYPLSFGQILSGLRSEENCCDSLLLQYQNENFAWDKPESKRRALLIKASGSIDNPRGVVFGRFPLDKIAPGTVLELESKLFTAEVVADGPTRVLRVSDASMPRISSVRQGDFENFQNSPGMSKPLATSFTIKISYGIGISVVDFSPKELLYVCLEDVEFDKKTDNKKDDVHFSIGNIKLNNQLWVTPYPIFLKMGRRRGKTHFRKRNRRHDAVSISWRCSLNTHGGYGNLTLLDWIEISSDHIFANVDGELVGLLFRMAHQIGCIKSSEKQSSAFQSRDEELKSLLVVNGAGEYIDDGATTKAQNTFQNDIVGETLTTAALAAKLKNSPAYNHKSTPRSGHYLIQNAARKRKKQPLSKVQHKFYIEQLKISTTKADLSWSGALPGILSSSFFKALTFERLPVRLRPFSNSHAYGNLEEHLQILSSHYMSIWRAVDLLMGLSSNPTFLFRGALHTFREGNASILDSWSSYLKYYSRELTNMLPRDSKIQPIYDDGNPLNDVEHRTHVLKRISAPFVSGFASILNSTSSVISLLSMQMKYSPKSSSVRHIRGFVRSRNPRLFAHLDGKDLLVEYVEGENAGKALLSRVRAGLHLGEGYLYHAEGVRQLKFNFKFKGDIDPASLILMITVERMILLTGKLDENFCSVKWEAYFTNISHIDLLPYSEKSNFAYDEIVVWHLLDPEFSEGNNIEKGNNHSKNLVIGVDVLHCKSIFVPHPAGEHILKKIKLIDGRF